MLFFNINVYCSSYSKEKPFFIEYFVLHRITVTLKENKT